MGYGHTDPIGRWTDFEESENGLEVRGMISDTTLGNDALTLIRDGALTGLSIGFYPGVEQFAEAGEAVTFDTPFGERTYEFDGPTFYQLEADVAEASVVMAPSDDEARLNHRQRAMRELPDLSDASPAEIKSEIQRLAADDGSPLGVPERRAIITRYAQALDRTTTTDRMNDVVSVVFNVDIDTAEDADDEAAEGETPVDTPAGASLADVLNNAATAAIGTAGEASVIDELCDAAGTDEVEVRAILDGEVTPSRDQLAALCEALGLDFDELSELGETVAEDNDAETFAALAGLRDSVEALETKMRPVESLGSPING